MVPPPTLPAKPTHLHTSFPHIPYQLRPPTRPRPHPLPQGRCCLHPGQAGSTAPWLSLPSSALPAILPPAQLPLTRDMQLTVQLVVGEGSWETGGAHHPPNSQQTPRPEAQPVDNGGDGGAATFNRIPAGTAVGKAAGVVRPAEAGQLAAAIGQAAATYQLPGQQRPPQACTLRPWGPGHRAAALHGLGMMGQLWGGAGVGGVQVTGVRRVGGVVQLRVERAWGHAPGVVGERKKRVGEEEEGEECSSDEDKEEEGEQENEEGEQDGADWGSVDESVSAGDVSDEEKRGGEVDEDEGADERMEEEQGAGEAQGQRRKQEGRSQESAPGATGAVAGGSQGEAASAGEGAWISLVSRSENRLAASLHVHSHPQHF